ncbi:hypothetical protein EW026_g6470 [Hermanssonia centrifuga]|uniref:Transmembrane protein n=1 Tax=Hermanssonia centrifuga TaxID=98765 RepID=A0A4S4KAX5_9APHY|nr:hypothetical protein EW026_g6470 [Hermanssonia centrifuga]
MVDWKSPEVQGFCAFLFSQMTVFTLGAYLWYFLLTWREVELKLVARRVKFKYAQAEELPTSLMIWKDNKYVTAALVFFSSAQLIFAVVLGAAGVKTQWDAHYNVCIIVSQNPQKGLFSFYMYTILWDTCILIYTVIGLRQKGVGGRSPLWTILFSQGVAYVIVTCFTTVTDYVIPSDTMNIFFVVPGCTASVMASSAVVISLLNMDSPVNIRSHVSNADSEHVRANTETDDPSKLALTSQIDCRW